MSKNFKKNPLSLLGFLLFIPSFLLNILFFLNFQKKQEGIAVLGVIDGDTITLEGKTRLRLRNIDAPELEFCGGEQAKKALEKLVSRKKVIVKEEIIDQMGRPMAIIYVGNKLINEEMLKTGWVRFHSDNTKQREILKKAYDGARNKKIGIYSPLCYQTENPENPKCNIKGNFDKNSDRKNYYFPGCPQYGFTVVEKDIGENWFCSEDEAAAAGFTRALNCPNP